MKVHITKYMLLAKPMNSTTMACASHRFKKQ